MADSFTSRLRLNKPEVGANQDAWAVLLNSGMISLVEQSIAGVQEIDVGSGNVTLSANNGASDQARAMILRATGSPGTSRNITAPNVDKLYIVQNDSDSNVVVLPSGFSGVTIIPGQQTGVYCLAGVGAFEVELDADAVTDQGALGSFTFDITGAGGGTTSVDCEYLVQGDYCYINIENFVATTVTGTAMTLTIDSGTIPSAIRPAEPQYIPVALWEDTGGGYAYTPSHLRVLNHATAWSIVQPDGSVYTNGSDRGVLHHITAVYPLVATP